MIVQKTKTAAHKLFILTLQCLWFLAVAIPIMLYFERPPVSVYVDRSIEPAKVYPGEEITINIKAAKTKDCPAVVYRELHDSSGRVFTFDPEPRPKQETFPVKKVVPIDAFPGPAEYHATLEWSCNWVQKFFPRVVDQPPISFEIMPTPEQMPLLEKQGKLEYYDTTPLGEVE